MLAKETVSIIEGDRSKAENINLGKTTQMH